MDLLTYSREHDLPPKWDGHPTHWDGWRDTPIMFIRQPDRDVCVACGSTTRPIMNSGIVHIDIDGLTQPIRKGRLYVFRCLDCYHDTIHNVNTGEWWELDHTDYGPHGSHHPEENATDEEEQET